MDKNKPTNYTDAQTAIIIAAANANGGRLNLDIAKALAARADMRDGDNNERNYRWVVAKISRLVTSGDVAGYDRKQPTTKDGKPVTKKADLVARIAAATDIAVAELESMDKSSKRALELVVAAVEDLRADADAALDGDGEGEAEAA